MPPIPKVKKKAKSTSSNSDEIYCVKCKAKTGNKKVSQEKTSNGRNMLRTKCETCGTTKTKFIA